MEIQLYDYIYERKMRGLREFVSIGQGLIVLSCQLVLVMFHAVWRQRQRNAMIWEYPSCELNVHYVRTYAEKVFPCPI